MPELWISQVYKSEAVSHGWETEFPPVNFLIPAGGIQNRLNLASRQ